LAEGHVTAKDLAARPLCRGASIARRYRPCQFRVCCSLDAQQFRRRYPCKELIESGKAAYVLRVCAQKLRR
jgi:hypothetical protein